MSHCVKLDQKMNITDIQDLKDDLKKESDPVNQAIARARVETEQRK